MTTNVPPSTSPLAGSTDVIASVVVSGPLASAGDDGGFVELLSDDDDEPGAGDGGVDDDPHAMTNTNVQSGRASDIPSMIGGRGPQSSTLRERGGRSD